MPPAGGVVKKHHETIVVGPEVFYGTKRSPRFTMRHNGVVIGRSAQPLYDAARILLKAGYPGETLLTTRRHDRDFDSFEPAPIAELAQWTVVESGGGIHRARWRDFPVRGEAQP
jgi:hypothetical protein